MAVVATVNIADYPSGLHGDGVTDDSAAFTWARGQIESATESNSFSQYSNRRGRVRVEIPGGRFLINSPKAFLRDGFGGNNAINGLDFAGAGKGETQIIYSPSATDQYLVYNDRWIHVKFSDMEIVGWPSETTRNSFDYENYPCFMYSVVGSPGYTPQSFEFENVRWDGFWKVGLELDGTDNNSEHVFDHCFVIGDYKRFLWVKGDDQMVCHNFYATDFWPMAGVMIDLDKGGHVNVHGGSWLFSKTDIAVGVRDQIMIRANNPAPVAGTAAMDLRAIRLEMRSINNVFIESTWAGGAIRLTSIDAGATYGGQGPVDPATGQYNVSKAADHVWAKFRSTGTLPVIAWEGCQLPGRHQYEYTSSGFNYARNIAYRDCVIRNKRAPDEFIYALATDSTTNAGGKPRVTFDNCRSMLNGVSTTGNISASSTALTVTDAGGIANTDAIRVRGAGASGADLVTTVSSGGVTTSLTLAAAAGTTVTGAIVETTKTTSAYRFNAQWECDLNWRESKATVSRARVLNLNDGAGKLPGNGTTLDFFLPKKSMLQLIVLNVEAGETSSHATNWLYQLKDDAGTVLASFGPVGNDPAAGFQGRQELFRPLDTNVRRHLSLVATGTSMPSLPGIFAVEYV